VDSPLGNPPQLRPAVIGGAINLAVSQHSFRLSLILIVSVRPSRDIHDWPLYGDEYVGMKVGNMLLI
jgi:hypothetical protein